MVQRTILPSRFRWKSFGSSWTSWSGNVNINRYSTGRGLGEIIGDSVPMRQVYDLIRRIAKASATVPLSPVINSVAGVLATRSIR